MLQDSIFSIAKTTNLASAVFNYLQPSDEFADKTPLGGILSDAKFGWLALGPKFCVIDLRTGLKVAAWTFGATASNSQTAVRGVTELPVPLTAHSRQLVISLECDDITGMICVFHVNGSQILHSIQTEAIVTNLVVADSITNGPFACFDGIVMCGTNDGKIFAYDLNRAGLLQSLKDMSQGNQEHLRDETNSADLMFLPMKYNRNIHEQREIALENDDHIAVMLNENSHVDGQYKFYNPDGTIRMKSKTDHVWVSTLQYIPQLGSLAVGYNFGAFQIWDLMTLELVFTSQVNVECLPVTHFGFQEPCDDPRAFCYLWVVYSVMDRFEERVYPLAVMYSLTYQGKRMLSDTKCLYEEFITSAIRFQVELNSIQGPAFHLVGGRCVACHTYSIPSTLGDDAEDNMLNLCQLVWECWNDNPNLPTHYAMLLFDIDQWYKDQMPATYQLQNTAFMSIANLELAQGHTQMLDLRLCTNTLMRYSHATRLEEHFYPNSLQYKCVCLNTSETCVLATSGVQRQLISAMNEAGPTVLLSPARLYRQCAAAGLAPLYLNAVVGAAPEEQRQFLLSVALEARLSCFLKRCAHDWATGTHSGAGCTLPLLVEWCWHRAIDLKQNAKELIAPLFTSSSMPDRNVCRCLEHCVRQLGQLTGLLDAVLTKCCNLLVPDALTEIEEKFKGIGTVALYFQVVQWFLNVGLLPERQDLDAEGGRLPYPGQNLDQFYKKRRMKLHRLQEGTLDDDAGNKSCSLLYIDQLIEQECGGERIYSLWRSGSGPGSEARAGLYPPPSLHALLRLYLLPDLLEQHKHSLLLYLLLDYSMLYDHLRYEAIIRRLMQFPTMFGLSNTAIKATQAFWHLDHRDFEFALDQLQCLTGNTLSEWQHHVALSSLLAQKKTQAALQYLHVRKPAPIAVTKDEVHVQANDKGRPDDWQSCCNLYLARGLVFEAMDVVRMCTRNASSVQEKVDILTFFFTSCRNTGHLSKILQLMLLPFEEEVFIQYLDGCKDSQTSDILVMYLLQQARYVEAQRYNARLRHSAGEGGGGDGNEARDTLVEVVCAALPAIATKVANCAMQPAATNAQVNTPLQPMSVTVHVKSPQNTFSYKSSFIQDTISNARETWLRRGVKRAHSIEDTPFLCTPKLNRTGKSIFKEDILPEPQSTPSKRQRLVASTPNQPSASKLSANMAREMDTLLEMPEVALTPQGKFHDVSDTRSLGATTPQSILKVRREPSPTCSNADSDNDSLDTASNHTHYSDGTAKHLRFTIPTASDSGTTPSPTPVPAPFAATPTQSNMDPQHSDEESNPYESPPKKLAIEEIHIKKVYKDNVRGRRSLSVSANSSLSEEPSRSMESIADLPVTLVNPNYSRGSRVIDLDSTGDEPIEIDDSGTSSFSYRLSPPTVPSCRRSIKSNIDRSKSPTPVRMDSPTVTSLTKRITRSSSLTPERADSPTVTPHSRRMNRHRLKTPELEYTMGSPMLEVIVERPREESKDAPHGAASSATSATGRRSSSLTPERADSPTVTPHSKRMDRHRLKTPELEYTVGSPTLEVIVERPREESQNATHEAAGNLNSATGRSFSKIRSRTPERKDSVLMAPALEVISESTETKEKNDSDMPTTRRSLRSRSRTPDMEVTSESETVTTSPRTLRSRSKTPERESVILLSPKSVNKTKKSLSRMVLEANTFAKTKGTQAKEAQDSTEGNDIEESSDSIIGCTPLKPHGHSASDALMNVSISPIINRYTENVSPNDVFEKDDNKAVDPVTPVTPNIFGTSLFGTSVLKSCDSSVAEYSGEVEPDKDLPQEKQTLLTVATKTPSTSFNMSIFDKSVLKSYDSIAENSRTIESSVNIGKIVQNKPVTKESLNLTSASNKSVLRDESSLITSDSDIVMEEEDNRESYFINEQKSAAAIDKEKQTIGEIEREIDEIEGISEASMSDEEQSEDSEEEQEQEEHENVDVEEAIEVCELSPENLYESETSSSGSNKLQIDEDETAQEQNVSVSVHQEPRPSSGITESVPEVYDTVDIEDTDMDFIDVVNVANVNSNVTSDPLSHENCSILTDDNSVLESDRSVLHLLDSTDSTLKDTSAEQLEKPQMEDVENNPKPQTIDEECDTEVQMSVIISKELVDSPQRDTAEAENKTEEVDVVDAVIQRRDVDETEAVGKKVESPKPISVDEGKVSNSPGIDRGASDLEKTPAKIRPRRRSAKSIDAASKETPQTSTKEQSVRKILTRRASRELSESTSDATEGNETAVTPARRTRSSSKVDDGDINTDEVKMTPGRRGRRSMLPTKPDLTVIPEVTTEDTSAAGRARRQKMDLLDSGSPKPITRRRRTNSRLSVEDDSIPPEVKSQIFDVQSLTPVDLLNVKDFAGTPDKAELHHRFSPDSLASESASPTPRMKRAMSETKSLTKVKPPRRFSVDTEVTLEAAGSPRTRRASFNRALEALHTPTRRPSTDKRIDTGSPLTLFTVSEGGEEEADEGGKREEAEGSGGESPPTTPARRTRRARSSTSQTKSLRSKKI